MNWLTWIAFLGLAILLASLSGCSMPMKECDGHSIGERYNQTGGFGFCVCTLGTRGVEKVCTSASGPNMPNGGGPDECYDCGHFPLPPNRTVIWGSVIKGDFAEDTRDPRAVCEAYKSQSNLSGCLLTEAKSSYNSTECANGMSIAGCFACRFECRS